MSQVLTNHTKKKFPYKLILLVFIIALGVVLHHLGIFDWYRFLDIGERYAHTWWFPLVVVVTKAVLYTFALPGSAMYWVSGLFFTPVYATLIVVAGGVSGALLAYRFAQGMSKDSAERIRSSRFFKVLRNHSDFATLSAIRSLPNFPHSIINYGCGILNIPMPRFLLSTVIGFTAKGFLYTSAIHHAATADDLSDVFTLQTVLPLIALTLLFIIGKLLQKKLPARSTEPEREIP
jgi:uncharacterized membrane protein YdjX (TVP38/TMEM64 family)